MKTETEHEVEKRNVVQETPAGEAEREAVSTRTEYHDERAPYWTVRNVIYYIVGIIEILLGFRFIFKLAGANPESGFVSFIYSVTDVLVAPFANIFGAASYSGAETTGFFEPASLVAIMVYAVAAWLLAKLISILVTSKKA